MVHTPSVFANKTHLFALFSRVSLLFHAEEHDLHSTSLPVFNAVTYYGLYLQNHTEGRHTIQDTVAYFQPDSLLAPEISQQRPEQIWRTINGVSLVCVALCTEKQRRRKRIRVKSWPRRRYRRWERFLIGCWRTSTGGSKISGQNMFQT